MKELKVGNWIQVTKDIFILGTNIRGMVFRVTNIFGLAVVWAISNDETFKIQLTNTEFKIVGLSPNHM